MRRRKGVLPKGRTLNAAVQLSADSTERGTSPGRSTSAKAMAPEFQAAGARG